MSQVNECVNVFLWAYNNIPIQNLILIIILGLWRECAAWLTRCKVIPIEHKANANESEIRVLALTLRDGVLLCNLVNFLDPKAGLDFNRKPQMAQVCFIFYKKIEGPT